MAAIAQAKSSQDLITANVGVEAAWARLDEDLTLENAPIGMGWIDGNGRIVACNAEFAALLEFNRLNPPSFNSFLPEQKPVWQAWDGSPAGSTQRIETHVQTTGGRRIPVAIRARGVNTSTGPLELLLIEDLTEQHKMQQHIANAQRLESVGVLAGGIAHDLNNNLSPILLGLDLLRSSANGAQGHLIDNMLASAQRAAGLVTQMLMFAKRKEMRLEKLEAVRLLDELRRIVTNTFPKSITCEIGAAPGLPPLLGDDVHLMRVLLNLALNARDAMPEGGKLTVRAEAVEVDKTHPASIGEAKIGRYVRFTVSDTGTGMPPEVRDRIFDPFFTTKGPDKGTGLGLSAVMGIVEKHQGFLSLYTEVGRGTRFHVNIPATGGATPNPTGSSEKIWPEGRGQLALVADDEVIVRTVLVQALEQLGFRTLTAEDGAQALGLCARHQHELALLVTDLHMPNIDGIDLLRATRRIRPQLPAIVMSGRFLDDERKALESLGSPQLLPKPFNRGELSSALRAALGVA